MASGRNKWLFLLFAGPAILLVTVFLIYPTIQTVLFSFADGTMLNPTRAYVGLANFVKLLTTDRTFLRLDRFPPSGVLVNTAIWVLVFPPITVGIGLLLAVLGDKKPY